MDLTNHTFAILNQSHIFIELHEVSYDGNLYYYDPRDDDIWTVAKFVREIHGRTAKIEDYLYYKDGTAGDGWKRWIRPLKI